MVRGGTLTAYLGAVDERVTAAAVACYFSTLGRELERGTCNYDAEQIIWGMAKHGIDKPDMLRARAPKATAVILTSHDCFPILGGREGFAEVEDAFRAHGDASKLYASEAPGFHEVTETGLEAVKMFFEEELQPAWRPSVSEPTPLPCNMLWFGNRELEVGASAGTKRELVPQMLRRLARPLLARLRARRAQAAAAGSRWLSSLRRVSARVARVPSGAAQEVALASDSTNHNTLVAARTQYFSSGKEEWFILYTEGSCAVTLRLFQSTRGFPKEEAVVLIFGGATDLNRRLTQQEDMLLNELQDRGFGAVAICGLCGQGDAFWRDGLWQFAPLLIGQTHTGFHASEVLQTVSWAFRQLRTRKAALHVPSGLGALVLLWLPSFSDVVRARDHRLPWQMQMHGVLEHYDLSDLVAAVKVPTLVLEPRGAARRPLPRGEASRSFRLARRANRGLRILAGPLSKARRAREIASFVSARLKLGAVG
ncbi:unnamed protein product [Effrenium voratum]|uniref:Uncharacterized protein n=1 Tax=Effrenium voratum TaxID=2562239 RepID=A0AA36IVJ5_9DINO|nr:unnamed protein product [Effrenium voratum]